MGASTLNKKDLFRLHVREVEEDYATLMRSCDYYESQIESLQDENAKLRELTKDACTVLRNHYNKEWFDGTVFAERMRELGIEVPHD